MGASSEAGSHENGACVNPKWNEKGDKMLFCQMLSYDRHSGTGDWRRALFCPGRWIGEGSLRKWYPESRVNSKPRGRLVQTEETEDSRDTENTSPIVQERCQWSWSPRPLDWGQARNESTIIGLTDDIIVHSMTLNVSLNIFKHLRLLFQKRCPEQKAWEVQRIWTEGCGREKECSWWSQCVFVKHKKGCRETNASEGGGEFAVFRFLA